jgi:hypothetical protein
MRAFAIAAMIFCFVALPAVAQDGAPPPTLAQVHKLYLEPMGGGDSKGNPLQLEQYIKADCRPDCVIVLQLLPGKRTQTQ